MPLNPKASVSHNISEMVHAGHPQNQAIAAALNVARSAKATGGYIPLKHGGRAEDYLGEHYQDGGEIEPPQKTVKAYKLFRTSPKSPGQLFPMFVDANTPVPIGKWVAAKAGDPGKDPKKVKSKLGDLAYRPGWHASDLPVATHIGGKSSPDLKAPDYRPDNHVWAEVEMPDDVDWQSVANSRMEYTKAGMPKPVTAHITDQVPFGGHYRYKTNPNMTGNWMIGGSMKVNRALGDDEVKAINDANGAADLPRLARADGGDVSAWHPNHPIHRTAKADGGGFSNNQQLGHVPELASVPKTPTMGNKVVVHEGPIHSPVAGRTDHLPMHVKSGSYVIPADIIGAMGEGNTMAGFKVARRMFSSNPYFQKSMSPYGSSSPIYNSDEKPYGARAAGGGTPGIGHNGAPQDDEDNDLVPIVAAGGEYVISPQDVTRLGKGDIDDGHKTLDSFVTKYRKKTIKVLQNLPGPKRD